MANYIQTIQAILDKIYSLTISVDNVDTLSSLISQYESISSISDIDFDNDVISELHDFRNILDSLTLDSNQSLIYDSPLGIPLLDSKGLLKLGQLGFSLSPNLFNKHVVTFGYYISVDGSLVENLAYSVTDYIPVVDSFEYVFSGSQTYSYCFFDSSKNFVSGSFLNGALIIPANVSFIRLTIATSNLDYYQFEKGSLLSLYSEFGSYSSNGSSSLEKLLNFETLSNKNLSNGYVGLNSKKLISLEFLGLSSSSNLFNIDNVIYSYYISTNGSLVSDSNYFVTDYISVIELSKYVFSGIQTLPFCFFDSNKNFVSGSFLNGDLVIPANVSFIRLSGAVSQINSYQFEKGSSLSVYSNFNDFIAGDSEIVKICRKGINFNRFSGLKANFLGDSITYGYDSVNDNKLVNSFPKVVGEMLGLITSRNYGIGGSTISNNQSSMSERFLNMDDDADLIFVAGGTNDWAYSVPLGIISDLTNETFYGGLNVLFDGLITKYPDKTIVIATPIHRVHDYNLVNGESFLSFVNAVKEVSEKFGLPLLDLYSSSGIYPTNQANHDKYTPDGLHPNELGHLKLSNRIFGFINTL